MRLSKTFMLLCTASLALWCADSLAAPRFDISECFPLGFSYVPNQWCTVSANITNLGEEADVDLAVTVRKGLRTVRYVRAVHLPAYAKRSAAIRALLMGDNAPTVELLDKQGATLASARASGVGIPWTRLLIMGMDDQFLLPGPGGELGRGGETVTRGAAPTVTGQGGLTANAAPLGDTRRPAFAALTLPEFPDRWAGLDSFGVVALGHVDHSFWRPSQVEQLLTWVESGGVLLLCPGADYAAWRGSPIERLLPVRIFGLRKQNWLTLEREETKWEASLGSYVDVLESELSDGEVVYRDGDLPMVVKKRFGMGVIYYFAFPGSALDSWKDRDAFLSLILRSQERIKPLTQTRLLDNGPRMLDEVAGAQVAPPVFVAATLGGFFVLAAISLLVFHLRGRSELAWAVIIPAGVVIAVVSYYVGASYSRKVGLSINEIAVASAGSGSPAAFRSGLLGVHSPDQLDTQLTADNEDTVFASSFGVKGKGGEVTRETFRTSPLFTLEDLSVQPGAFPYYIVDSLVNVGGGVTAEFDLGQDGLTGTVKNNTAMRLENCLVTANSYPFTMTQTGLAPGQSVKVALSDSSARKRGDFTTEGVLGSKSQTRKAIVENLFTPGGDRPFVPWARSLFLVGWPDGTFISEKLGPSAGEAVTRSISALCVEAVVHPAAPGARVSIPHAFCTALARGDEVGLLYEDLSSKNLENPTPRLHLLFYMPDFAQNVDIEEADLHLSARAYGLTLGVYARHAATGEFVPLQSFKDLDSDAVLTIKDAGQFQNHRLNVLEFEIRVVPNGKDLDKQINEVLPSDVKWHLIEASATLRGTAK